MRFKNKLLTVEDAASIYQEPVAVIKAWCACETLASVQHEGCYRVYAPSLYELSLRQKRPIPTEAFERNHLLLLWVGHHVEVEGCSIMSTTTGSTIARLLSHHVFDVVVIDHAIVGGGLAAELGRELVMNKFHGKPLVVHAVTVETAKQYRYRPHSQAIVVRSPVEAQKLANLFKTGVYV